MSDDDGPRWYLSTGTGTGTPQWWAERTETKTTPFFTSGGADRLPTRIVHTGVWRRRWRSLRAALGFPYQPKMLFSTRWEPFTAPGLPGPLMGRRTPPPLIVDDPAGRDGSA